MSSSIHQRQPLPPPPPPQHLLSGSYPVSPRNSPTWGRSIAVLARRGLLPLLMLVVLLGVVVPGMRLPDGLFGGPKVSVAKWREYTLEEAVPFVAENGTLIVCAVSYPYLQFLNNWLISICRQKHQDKVLVIAEDYATLYAVNDRWPGHAVLVPPVQDAQVAHKFGSQGFFNFTSRRPHHLLYILELGYNVMYNDVDMVWLADPFPYFQGDHDLYFTDDMTAVKPLNHSHDLPTPGKKGRTYICSCMIFMRSTNGAKLVMKEWIRELEAQPWSHTRKSNDQPAFNWALKSTAAQVDLYLLPQVAFPTGGLYFKNKTWWQETKGLHAIIHNNYITGFEKKIKRFRDFGLWLVDDHAMESPLGRL